MSPDFVLSLWYLLIGLSGLFSGGAIVLGLSLH